MDKKVAGLVGAISAVSAMGAIPPASAKDVVEVMTPRSYAELLQPIPNAVALLQADDLARDRSEGGNVQLAQWHHHHHHRWWRRYRHHHHHHRWWRRYHHHHHHHW